MSAVCRHRHAPDVMAGMPPFIAHAAQPEVLAPCAPAAIPGCPMRCPALSGWLTPTHPAAMRAPWVDADVAGLPEEFRPAGRLAPATALAAYQVDPDGLGQVARRGNNPEGTERIVTPVREP